MTNKTTIVVTAEDRASAVLRQVRSGVESAVSAMSTLAAGAAAVGAGAAVNGLRQLVGVIDDLDEAAQGLGTTAVELANLRQGAREAGIEAEQFDKALTRLNVRVSQAAEGNEDAARFFRAFGIEVRESTGQVRPATDVLRDLADAFRQLEAGPAKTALAVDLFGEKLGAKLIPVLNQGGDGLARFSGLTNETVREAAAAQAQIDRLAASWDRLKNTLAGGVLPVLNDTIDVIARVDFERAFSRILPGRILADINKQVQEAAARQEQLRQALALGAGAYSNEGRAAIQSADDIRARIQADEAATKAAKERANALERLRKQQEAEAAAALRAQQQGESQRDLLRLQRIDEAQRQADEAAAETARRLADLTGRSATEQLANDIRLIEDALFDGRISLEEFEAAYSKVFGLNSDLAKGIQQTKDAADQLALTITSSLGNFIDSGGPLRDFFAALLRDIAKLIVQLTVLEPLAKSLRAAFSGVGQGGGIGSLLGGLFGSIFGGPRANGGPVSMGKAYLVGERGPELFLPGASGQIAPMTAAPKITVNVINNNGSQVSTRDNGNGSIDVVIDAVESALSSRVASGRGALAGAIAGRYGLRPQVA